MVYRVFGKTPFEPPCKKIKNLLHWHMKGLVVALGVLVALAIIAITPMVVLAGTSPTYTITAHFSDGQTTHDFIYGTNIDLAVSRSIQMRGGASLDITLANFDLGILQDFFHGWFLDEARTIELDATITVARDMVIFAAWDWRD